MRKVVSRIGDMHPKRSLDIYQQADGDIVVLIREDGAVMGDGPGKDAAVEFCTIGGGGGRSEKTREALLNLMKAMEEDNKKWPIE